MGIFFKPCWYPQYHWMYKRKQLLEDDDNDQDDDDGESDHGSSGADGGGDGSGDGWGDCGGGAWTSHQTVLVHLPK